MKEENLIFIISQPRSGSTYLQNLLSNNTEVNTCSEPWVLLNYLNQIKPEYVRSYPDNYLATQALNDYLMSHENLDHQNLLKKHLLSIYAPLGEDHKLVIDKTPRYWEILDEIVALFPKSKIIILHRNPLKVLKSIIKTWDIKTFKTLNLFRRDLLMAPKKLFDFSLKNESNKQVYSLSYESLIKSTSYEVEKLYNWMGVTYNEAVLNTSQNKKYQGNFGDPFQNNNYATTKAKADGRKIPNKFKPLFWGYANFLGKSFLESYGYYSGKLKMKRSLAFNYFMQLGEDDERSFGKRLKIGWYLKIALYKLILGE